MRIATGRIAHGLGFFLLILLVSPVLAQADSILSALSGQAYDFSASLYRKPPPSGDATALLVQFTERLQAEDWAGAEPLGEGAIVAGGDNYEAWINLSLVKERLGKPQEAAFAAYLASDRAATAQERAGALIRAGLNLETAKQFELALAALGEALSVVEDPAGTEAYRRVSALVPFRAMDVTLGTDGDEPRACLSFDRQLQSTRKLRYEDFVRVEPEAEIAFVASGMELCLEGLQYATTYDLRLLKGMPAEAVGALAEDAEMQIIIGDRNPSVGFQSQAYVLPRGAGGGAPLTSVNADYVALRMLRINDRNLVQQIGHNTFLGNLYRWDSDQIAADTGEEIWRGGMKIEGERNRRVVTSVPVMEMIPELQPGVYVLTAMPAADPQAGAAEAAAGGQEEYWDVQATQWLIVSDIGLTTMSGANGLFVLARSLDSATPIEGVSLQLLARNNEVLATEITDAAGAARFDPGLLRGESGRAATAVLAFAGADFSFLDLTRAAYDLSDRGVSGRATQGEFDVFFYTDRGAYRPGETVRLSALLRDRAGRAKEETPVWLRLIRPDGAEAARYDNLAGTAGGFQQAIEIAETARTGQWSIEARIDPEGEAVASTSFLVEDVVPARIETTLTPSATEVIPGKALAVDGLVKFLYGAPAAGLAVKSDIVVSRDEAPFPEYATHEFGLEEEVVEPKRVTAPDQETGSDGEFKLPIELGDLPDVSSPLVAKLRVEAYEFGGRPVIESIDLKVRNRPLWLGIRPLFGNAEVDFGGTADFELLALDGNGQRIEAPSVKYRLIKEEWDYNWYFAQGSWDYHVLVRDGDVRGGEVAIGPTEPARVAEVVDWGNYRLEIFDPESGAASSVRFHAGWSAKPGQASTPDQLRVVADRDSYQPGDVAQVMIDAPFAGEAQVTIATDRVIETRVVSLPDDGATIDVEIDPEWGAGAYVLASAFRPGIGAERGPGRAIGVAWLGLDPAPRSLGVALEIPERVLPRQRVEIPVSVSGMAGDRAYLTLAAVDEGVLTLTDFVTPDPVDHFFGKKRLMVDLRDLYGQLIDAKSGRRGQIREGGDTMLNQRGAPKKIELVALFSGLVTVGADGKARIGFDLPDYNGRLRLMAVAYDSEKVGWAEGGLVVRDPVIADIAAPRFLAPGDESVVSLSIKNLDGPAGNYQGKLTSEGDVQMGLGAEFAIDLSPGSGTEMRIPILGQRVGAGAATLTLKGPEGFQLSRSIAIPVRPAQTQITETLSRQLAPGEGIDLRKAAIAPFIAGTGRLQASFSTLPNLDVQTILASLDHYAYGCLEQTTSKAFPLLVAGEVAELWSLEDRYRELDRKELQGAIRRIVNQQRYDGLFGLWSAADSAEPWLSAYAVDFLMRAKERGLLVSDFTVTRGLDALEQMALGRLGGGSGHDRYGTGMAARSYAFYILARANRARLSDLRYWFDSQDLATQAPLALSQLSAALALNGETERARQGFEVALDTWRKSKTISGEWDYGSSLRDIAAIVTLVAESGLSGFDIPAMLANIADAQGGRRWLSTQEQAWVLRAAQATAGRSPHLRLAVTDQGSIDQDKDFVLKPDPASLTDTGIAIVNKGDGVVYAKLSASGFPLADLPAVEEGFLIDRQVLNAEGNPIALDAMRQNDMAVILLKGRSVGAGNHQALLVDLLPAGWEIENANLANTRQAQDFAWLPPLTQASYVEYRDDRYVAAFDVRDEGGQLINSEFTFAYVVRAVTPGEYKLPAPSIEDMYQPERRGRGRVGRVVIGAAQ